VCGNFEQGVPLMRSLRIILLAVMICLVSLGNALAQGDLGALTGTVLDSSGAAIPGASVDVTNTETAAHWSIKSSSAGYYRVPVPPGSYRVEAQVEGFKKGVATVTVPVATVITVDLKLEVGSSATSVTVSTEAPLLTPSTAEVSSGVTPLEFQTLPIEVGDGGRNPQTFIFSSLPGTQGDTFSGSINGGQLFSHEILIDGLSIGRYDLSGGSMDEYSPGTDAIGEFKVQMTNYSAEYGSTGGGIANFSLKSGTNHFHGTAFEYNKNPVFNAAGLLANAFGSAKRNERENNFGGTLGGPIRKNKTFFFFSYEGDRFSNFAYSGTTSIPTQAMVGGDFGSFLGAQVGTDALGRPVFKNEIYDPTTTRTVAAGAADPVTGLLNTTGNNAVIRDAFPGNVIPAGEFSTATSTLLPLFPAPLFGGNIRNTPVFSGCCPILRRNAYNIKIDQVVSANHKLTGTFGWYTRFRWHRNGSSFPPFPGQPISPTKNQSVGGPQIRLSDNWVINDHSVNVISVGYNRFNNINNISPDAKFTGPMGIPGIPNTCFPPMRFSTKTSTPFMKLIGDGCENIDPSESYIYQDTYSTTHGKHSLKFGGEFTRYRYNTYEPGNLSGTFSFSSIETALPGFTSSTGHPFASFILGGADGASKSIYGTEPGYRAGSFAFFAQDDWKATPKLTLNLGVRWDIPLPKKEAFNRQSGFDPTVPNPGADNFPGALVFLGNCSGCINRTSFQDWYFKEVAPRLGVAYQISKNLVLRGGYGISYSPPILNNFGTQNLFGFNSGVSVHHGSGTAGAFNPVTYLSSLVSTPLPAGSKVGLPAFTGTLPNRDPASANGNGLDFLPRNSLAQPYVQNWSAGFQYQLPHEVLLEANYIGSKGTRLLDSYFSNWFNQPDSKFMALGDNLDMGFQDALDAGILQPYGITQLPFPSFEANSYCGDSVSVGLQRYPQYCGLTNNYPTMGSSTYHSLQIMARKQSANGLTFIAAYTLSKTLTNTDTALYYPSDSVVQDFYNRKVEKSIALFDHPQSLKLTWIYSLPFGRGKKWLNSAGAADRLVSGWQITAIQQYLSGDPLTIYSSLGTSFTPGIRPDVVLGVKQTVASTGLDVINGTPYLNPAAFVDPPSSPDSGYPLRLGTAPRLLPNVRGPGHMNEDFGIVKNTKISEGVSFQARADMFNVFNRTGLGNPDTGVNDGSFGLIFGPANGPRVIQLALRLNF
jgi:outer membrane receptor protein involved in Fe transport